MTCNFESVTSDGLLGSCPQRALGRRISRPPMTRDQRCYVYRWHRRPFLSIKNSLPSIGYKGCYQHLSSGAISGSQFRNAGFPIPRCGGECFSSSGSQRTAAGRQIISTLASGLFRHGIEFHDQNLLSPDAWRKTFEALPKCPLHPKHGDYRQWALSRGFYVALRSALLTYLEFL